MRKRESLRAVAAMCVAALFTGSGAEAAQYKSAELQQAESAIKMIIGLNHKRCAEIVYVAKLQGSVYGVTCIKTAGRPARVHYAVDAANNAVVGVR